MFHRQSLCTRRGFCFGLKAGWFFFETLKPLLDLPVPAPLLILILRSVVQSFDQ